MKARSASCLLWTLLALPACGAEDAIGTSRLPITGGAEESGYPAVFALAYDGIGGCTATCIAPRFALTAAHCVEGESPKHLTALFGERELEPQIVIEVSALAMEPDGGDIAMLKLADPCPAVIPANRELLEGHVDEPVVMVGYGVTTEEGEDYGIKRSGIATLFSVDPQEVNGLYAGELATSNDPAGTCYGDSGGPTFMTLGGVEVNVGVTSRGSLDDTGRDEPCGSGLSIAVRADSYTTFIDEFIAAHDVGPDPVDPDGADPDGDPDDPGADGAVDDPELPDETDGLGAVEDGPEVGARRAAAAGCRIVGATAGNGPAVLIVLAVLLGRRRRCDRVRRGTARVSSR